MVGSRVKHTFKFQMDARHEQELNTLMQKHAQEVTALLKRQAEERNRYAERFTEHVIAALVDGMKDYGRSAEAVRDSMERKVEEAQRMDEDGAVEPSVDEIAHRAEPKLLTEEEDDELQHQSYLSDLRKVEALEREERRAQEQPQKVDVEPSDDAWKRHTQE